MFSTVQEAAQVVKRRSDKGFVLFAGPDKVRQLSQLVGSHTVLCSTAGEYTPSGFRQDIVTGFEYDPDDAEVVEILYPPIKSSEALKQSYVKVRDNPNAFLLLLCDGLSGMEESIITTLYFMDAGFKIVGGSAGDSLQFKETPIYIGSRKVHSVALYFNPKRRTEAIKENIYVPIGKKLLVTEADPINRLVRTFNNRPASTEYAQALGVREEDLPQYFMNNPLGKRYENELFIASPMKVNADQSITFYSQITPNGFVEVLRPADPVAVMKETLQSVSFRPSFTLAINCILRSVKFQEDGIWEQLDKELLGFCPDITGFISYGEQFYKNHLNQTMVLLLVE